MGGHLLNPPAPTGVEGEVAPDAVLLEAVAFFVTGIAT
jgi:hypothetical protein